VDDKNVLTKQMRTDIDYLKQQAQKHLTVELFQTIVRNKNDGKLVEAVAQILSRRQRINNNDVSTRI